MLFNTFEFAIFYLIVTVAYFAMPHRFRCIWLVAASYMFYMCSSVKYILVIIAITLIDYCAGIGIERSAGAQRKLLLAFSMMSNFGLLFLFKYSGLGWALPVGISFHTFQAVSYTFEVYRGNVRAERNLGIYALYVAFFPQMVAGPIERPQNLLPQFHTPKRFERARLTSGLRLALWGLIKKTVVADLAAPAVNTVYAHPQGFSGPVLALATALFAIQIYCDFSGYSDMAVGMARVMGYDLTTNFRQPYFAKSMTEFWRRWHISLSSWFRDYLYIPLGGNRASGARWVVNIAIVFLISGMWHGANWTFAVWGALHGFYILAGRATTRLRARVTPAQFPWLVTLAQVLTTNALAGIAWVFFRSASISDAIYVVSHMWDPRRFEIEDLFRLGLPRFEMGLLLVAIIGVFVCEFLASHPSRWLQGAFERRTFRWPAYAAAFYAVVFFGVFDHVDFIYFQF